MSREWDDTPRAPSALRVLVVDDDADTTESTAMLLSLYGHRVATACGGSEALLAAAADPPDVILTDLLMPGVDGYELARRVRDVTAGKPPVLVAVTGLASESDRKRSESAGFDLHLTKPVDPPLLNGLLRRLARTLAPPAGPEWNRGGDPGTVFAAPHYPFG